MMVVTFPFQPFVDDYNTNAHPQEHLNNFRLTYYPPPCNTRGWVVFCTASLCGSVCLSRNRPCVPIVSHPSESIRTRQDAVQGTTSISAHRIRTLKVKKSTVNRTICDGVTAKTDFGILRVLGLNFDLLTFNMQRSDRGT